ncbi:MAG: hypothetical protein CVV49_02735 [Spirochaetae bacterium HGW-Spirochaetae-5]|jgi:transposase-like protein|nr:MAG: hypothetical protein CVV49_02735 [Spirochaetae bacterium HGW-Spirochaetae-5]
MDKKTQRWTADRKAELELKIIKGELTLVEACRSNDLKQSEVEGWMDELLKSGTRVLKTPNRDSQDEQAREINEMKPRSGN